jgi:hypothetical protein
MRKTLERGTLVVPYEMLRVPVSRWEEIERAFIAALKDAGYRLTNTHPGGGGGDVVKDRGPWQPSDAWIEARKKTRGAKRSDETRQLMSDRIKQAYAEGKIRIPPEERSAAAKKSAETRRARRAAGEIPPARSWNTGMKLGPNPNISAGKLKGKKPQPELVQLVADEAGLSYAQTYRALKSTGVRPPENVVARAWAAYDKLGEQVADL